MAPTHTNARLHARLQARLLGNKSALQRKRYGRQGHATLNLNRRELNKWITAASALLPDSVVREFSGVLATLPTPRPQGSVNGMAAADKASTIVAHISKQRGDKAPRLILAAAAGVLAFDPMPTSSPMFSKVQTGRAMWRLLRADHIELYGKRKRLKISLQSHRVACQLYKIVEPCLYYWLKDGGRATIGARVRQRTTPYERDTLEA